MDVVFGIHAVEAVLRSKSRPVERLHVVQGARAERLERLLQLAREQSIPLHFEKGVVVDRLANSTAHQGIVAICGMKKYTSLEDILEAKQDAAFLVALDQVEDPRNLGAVLRTAAAAGVDGVIVTERRSVGLTSTVAKAAAGALEMIPVVRVTNLVQAIERMKETGIWIVGVEAGASKPWTEVDFCQPVTLVFGSEGGGIRRLVRERCDLLVSLPLSATAGITSLNVSVAAGILMYEVVRQRVQRRKNQTH